ncbi:MAG TPA: selenocysteine-specific translation elongation factor [Coriobacteriia bacterium]|nr:selenocysteine-specific translation elongation factor [Coriobacteriia bacterium]
MASDPSLVLGTAGHIDHGKSSLIKALTGVDPDRLKEEKDRGITIELGFARLELPSGRSMGVVDVPGHEKFVRQMVAGATGVDVVLLVVAADDGVMPQTREHLAIVDLLGIDRGVVALTKADLADADWVSLVKADIEQLLKGTSIEGAPVVAVSSKTGAGLPELLATLDEVATEAQPRQANLPLRLPVDRVFTIAGAGTVVTGTMWSGSAAKDDPVELYPSGITGRVRGVQVHSAPVERAHAGQRVAMNLAGIERDEIDRGDIVAAPGTLTPTDRFDARFTFLGTPGDDRPFESGARVHVHHGTREVLGRVLLMERDTLAPGQSCLAQVRLEEVLAPRYGDHYIVRSYSPVYTIGGGLVLDALPPRRTVLKAHERELLEALVAHDLTQASVGLLEARGLPMTSAEVASALGVPRASVADDLNKAKLERVKVAGETAFIAPEALEHMVATVEAQLLAFHEAEPNATGIASAALRDRVDRRLSPKGFDAILEVAVARDLVSVEKGQVSHPKAASSARAAEAAAEMSLLALLESQGLNPASIPELAAEAGADQGIARKVLGRLATEGRIVRVNSDMVFALSAFETARERVATHLSATPEGATAADLRSALDVSRKYAIPLLEYFDAQGYTKREGDLRVLRKA